MIVRVRCVELHKVHEQRVVAKDGVDQGWVLLQDESNHVHLHSSNGCDK